jgi:hypothetical protein
VPKISVSRQYMSLYQNKLIFLQKIPSYNKFSLGFLLILVKICLLFNVIFKNLLISLDYFEKSVFFYSIFKILLAKLSIEENAAGLHWVNNIVVKNVPRKAVVYLIYIYIVHVLKNNTFQKSITAKILFMRRCNLKKKKLQFRINLYGFHANCLVAFKIIHFALVDTLYEACRFLMKIGIQKLYT